MTISETITVWTIASIFIFFLWGLMMGDPGGSETQDAIITIVCAILALPVTIVILLIIGVIELILMIRRIRKKSKDKFAQ